MNSGLNRAQVTAIGNTYRLPILLCSIEGKAVGEAARQLGTTPGAIRGRLERGRERLRVRLLRRGFALPAALTVLLAAPRSVLARPLLEAVSRLANPAATISPAVAALASGTLASKWQLACTAFLLAGVLCLGGLGLFGSPPAGDKPGKNDDPLLQTPKTGAPFGAANAADAPVVGRVDAFGDPLPSGAVARMGSNRLHHGSNVHEVNVSADGCGSSPPTRG